MATEEELFAAIQSFEPVQMTPERQQAISAQRELVRLAKADVAAKEAAIPTIGPAIGTALSGIGQGLSLGLSDEALAGLSSLFGGSTYSQELAAQQAQREQMATAYPTTYLAGQLAGGIGGTIPAAGIAAPGLASRLLLGATGKAAPTLGQLAAIGATQGAITGAASAQPGERLVSGLLGGGVGLVAAPIVGKVAQVGGQKLGEALSIIKAAKPTTTSEMGAISLGGGPKFTEAEIDLAKLLSQTEPTNLTDAEIALMRAGELGKPVFLPEAVQSPALFQQAKLIANKPASVEIAKTAIESRAANAIDRMTQTLDLVNPQRNVTEGANRLVKGAENILETLGVARKEATSGLYESAFDKTPTLTKDNALELISTNPRIQQAINQVRKEIPELSDLPDNSLKVLHQAQQYLRGKARSLKNQYIAGKVTDARKALMQAIKAESPDYAEATNTFAKMSKGLTAKEESKIGFLANVSPNRPETIGRVFSLDADVIASLRSDFADAGLLNEWEAGVRSYLQRSLNKAQDERNPINKLIGSPELRTKLQAALGDKAERVIEPLSVEQTILQGQREYFAGSPTAPLLMQDEATKESLGAIRRGLEFLKDPTSGVGKFLSEALGGQKDKQFYENYARLLFSNPERGLETLGTIQELSKGFRTSREAGAALNRALGVSTGREAFTTLEGISDQAKSSRVNAAQTMTPPVVSPNIDDLFNEIQSFKGTTEAPITTNTKIGKQNISIPTGESYAPPELVKAVIKAESAGKPDAVSPKGAQGLMQLMPKTAKELGVDPTDPVANVEGGSRYLQQLISKYKSQDIALAAYNWGPGNIDKAISKLKARDKEVTWENIRKLSNVPLETRMYVSKVLKA